MVALSLVSRVECLGFGVALDLRFKAYAFSFEYQKMLGAGLSYYPLQPQLRPNTLNCSLTLNPKPKATTHHPKLKATPPNPNLNPPSLDLVCIAGKSLGLQDMSGLRPYGF